MQTPHESSWTPLLWAMKLLARAKSDKKITIENPSYANLQASFEKVENANRKLLSYSWINFPLAYTQVRYTLMFDNFKQIISGLYNFSSCKYLYCIRSGCKPCRYGVFLCRIIQPSISNSAFR